MHCNTARSISRILFCRLRSRIFPALPLPDVKVSRISRSRNTSRSSEKAPLPDARIWKTFIMKAHRRNGRRSRSSTGSMWSISGMWRRVPPCSRSLPNGTTIFPETKQFSRRISIFIASSLIASHRFFWLGPAVGIWRNISKSCEHIVFDNNIWTPGRCRAFRLWF